MATLVGISTFDIITARVAAFLVTSEDKPEGSSHDTTASDQLRLSPTARTRRCQTRVGLSVAVVM